MQIISILIPIHNRLQITQEGLKSLYKALNLHRDNGQGAIKYEVVVIDDGSTDGSSEWISQNYSGVHLLKGDGNLWWGGAINIGLEQALNKLHSNYILLWNDDLQINDDYFINLEKIILIDEFKNLIISSRVFYSQPSNKIFNNGGLFDFKTGKRTHYGYNKFENEIDKEVKTCQWTGGMGVLIPSYVFGRIGIFDNKHFPQYFGDMDFSLRATINGIQIICHPELCVWNDRGQTFQTEEISVWDFILSFFSKKSNHNILMEIELFRRYVSLPVTLKIVIKDQLIFSKRFMKYQIKKLIQ